ncbi:MAG: alkaline phosphatase D family protein, partial [Phycisphaerales bacterium]|nr:alkaline phosphatase D family protein [Phycisphaerales bacterium]
IQNLGVVAASDRFEGYAAERSMILDFIVQRGITNVVFIAADIHGTFVNNLTYQLNPRGPQLPTGAFEVTTGSVAYWAPFGQTVMGLLFRLGFLPPSQYEAYLALPQVLKDGFVQNIMNALLVGLGYDPLGLAGSEIDAELLDGAYTIVHTFGWTAFEIDASTAALTVSTYGIAPYGADDLLADPDAVTARVPALLGRFRVMPTGVGCPGDVSGSGDVGADDLAVLLAAWGPNRGHAADFNGDGDVGPSDLAILLGQWGPCPG